MEVGRCEKKNNAYKDGNERGEANSLSKPKTKSFV
jgi:hypothetical protein